MKPIGGAAGVRAIAFLAVSVLLPLPWLVTYLAGAEELGAGMRALLSGVAILGSAFLLSWATELAEQDVPQSLALLVLALVSVLPEYAVDLHFAVRAAEDVRYAGYAAANMTGANRLLIGLGWASVVLLACFRNRSTELPLAEHRRLEMRFLLLATLYSFLIPLNGEIGLGDAAVLLFLFGWYAAAASKGHSEEVELVGPAAWLDERLETRGRRLTILLLLAYAGYAIWVSAEPFAEGLVELGLETGIDEFLLVQWVAPLASESPEFLVAMLFAWRLRGSVGIGALLSSKVNQWTLLVGALPIAYALASGATAGLPLDRRQSEELFLTSAQSILATLLVSNLAFSRIEAILLAALFAVQLVFPDREVRLAFALLYLAVFAGLLVHSPERRASLRAVLRGPST